MQKLYTHISSWLLSTETAEDFGWNDRIKKLHPLISKSYWLFGKTCFYNVLHHTKLQNSFYLYNNRGKRPNFQDCTVFWELWFAFWFVCRFVLKWSISDITFKDNKKRRSKCLIQCCWYFQNTCRESEIGKTSAAGGVFWKTKNVFTIFINITKSAE